MRYKKVVSIIILLIMYFAALMVISYWLHPEENYIVEKKPENLVDYRDFSVQAGNNTAFVRENALVFQGDDSEAKVVAAKMQLADLQKINVSFSVDCPEAYAESSLHVDLCGEGYDADEQETVIKLQAGMNQVNTVLDKGDYAPESANIRIFALEPANYQVENLAIYRMVQKNNEMELHISAVVFVLSLVAYIIIILHRKKSS